MSNEEALKELKFFFEIYCTQPFPEYMEKAIKALEKQIPKKPYDIDEEMMTLTCPACLSNLYSNDVFSDYCCICGQKFDLGDIYDE